MPADTPKLISLRITANPSSTIWQIPLAGSRLSVLLVGWILDELPTDAVVPSGVAQILTQSLLQLAAAAYLHSPLTAVKPDQWSRVGNSWTTVLTRPGFAAIGEPREIPLVSTTDPDAARSLFSAEEFDWSQQKQVVLLTDREQQPPALTFAVVRDCFLRKNLEQRLAAGEPRLLGLLFPAVDGDFAAIVAGNAAFIERVAQQLREVSDAAGVPCSEVSEDQFQRTKWVAR